MYNADKTVDVNVVSFLGLDSLSIFSFTPQLILYFLAPVLNKLKIAFTISPYILQCILFIIVGPSAPAIVNITLNDTNSIILEWTSPEMVVKQIDKYCIRYRAQGMQWTMKNITVTVDDAFYSVSYIH